MSADFLRRTYNADDALLDFILERIDPECSEEELARQIEKELSALNRRTRRRKERDGAAYHTCSYWSNKVGVSANTIRREFSKEKDGVLRKPHSGRNRKTYIVMLISKAAIKRRYPEVQL
jgi:hypothetical protein